MLAILGFAGTISSGADMASHFRVAYALAMVAAILTYVPASRSMTWRAAALACVLLLDAVPIAALYVLPSARPGVAREGSRLRVLQFNAWERNPDVQQVLPWLVAESPDVAALEEVTEPLRAAIERDLSDRYHVLSDGSELLLLIRREPSTITLRDHAVHSLPGGGALSARLDVGGQAVEVLCLHAMAPFGIARAAIRDAQLEWVARWSALRPGAVIVLGDLNTSPWSHAFGRLLHDGVLIDSARGFGVQTTWRARFGRLPGGLVWPLQVPIDHCLHSPGLATKARRTGPACGSNHYPLRVTLQVIDPGVVKSLP